MSHDDITTTGESEAGSVCLTYRIIAEEIEKIILVKI